VCRQLLLARLQARGQVNERKRLACFAHGLDDLPAGNVLRTIEVCRQTRGQGSKRRLNHGFHSFTHPLIGEASFPE
jgi:hypothetical protein